MGETRKGSQKIVPRARFDLKKSPHRKLNEKRLARLAGIEPQREPERFTSFCGEVEKHWDHMERFYPEDRPNPKRFAEWNEHLSNARENQVPVERWRHAGRKEIEQIRDLAAKLRGLIDPIRMHGVASNLLFFRPQDYDDTAFGGGLNKTLSEDLSSLEGRCNAALTVEREGGELYLPLVDPGGGPLDGAWANREDVIGFSRIFLMTLSESVRLLPARLVPTLGDSDPTPWRDLELLQKKSARRRWKELVAFAETSGWEKRGTPKSSLTKFVKLAVPQPSPRLVRDYIRDARKTDALPPKLFEFPLE